MNTKLSMNVDKSHVLMSDVLRGQVPELEGEERETDQAEHVVVIAQKIVGPLKEALIGVLRGIHLGSEPEIEFRIDLSEAMSLISAKDLSFAGFELHHKTTVIPIPGPFTIKAARIDEISPIEQLCTIGLQLVKRAY